MDIDADTGRRGSQDWIIERGDPAELDRLRPLWESLLEHHSTIDAGVPQRPLSDSWRRRRAQYARWLAHRGFFVVARRADALLGYAMVELHEGSPMWDMGALTAELQTLVVLPGERRRHLGRALMDAVDRELRGLGVHDILVEIMTGNEEAARFYEGRGYGPYCSVLHRTLEPDGAKE